MLTNATHVYITPNSIFHSFPGDLHWLYYYSAMLCKLKTSLLQSTCFGLVPGEAQEFGGSRGQTRCPTQFLNTANAAPTVPNLTSLMLGTIQDDPLQNRKKASSRYTSILNISLYFWDLLLVELSAILLHSFSSPSDFLFLPPSGTEERWSRRETTKVSSTRTGFTFGSQHLWSNITILQVPMMLLSAFRHLFQGRGITRWLAPHLLRNPHIQLLAQVLAAPTRSGGTASFALVPYPQGTYKICWRRYKSRFRRLGPWFYLNNIRLQSSLVILTCWKKKKISKSHYLSGGLSCFLQGCLQWQQV